MPACPGRIGRLGKMAGSLIDGLSGVTTPRLGLPLLFWSVVIWAVISGFYWVVLLAFEPGHHSSLDWPLPRSRLWV